MFSSSFLRFLTAASWIGAIISSSAPLGAIAINNVDTPGYVTGTGNFTGVTRILFEGANGSLFICSGALINPMYVVTAGHCVSGASNWQVAFETPGFNSLVIGVDGSFLHPAFAPRPSPVDNLYEYDVAVLRLSSPAPADAEVYGLHRTLDDVLPASTVDIVGYGLGGNPEVGYYDAGTRRHAVNTIDGALDSLLGASTPDHPLQMTLIFGASTDPGRGLINGGDSGGPLLFNGQILGIASYLSMPRPGSGVYQTGVEYLSGHENVADPVIGNWLAQFEAAEPKATLLLALGVAIIAVARIGGRLRRFIP
jgi:hypothetical protein